MDDCDHIDELHQLAEHRRAKKMLRHSGWVAVAFGCINAFIAYSWIQHPFICIIIAFIAAAMLIVGFWELLLPMAEAIIADGIIAIVIGVLDIFITVARGAAFVLVSIQWGIVGGLIIAWGVSRFRSYRRLADALREKPQPEAMERLDQIVELIKKLKSKDAPEIIGFRMPLRFMRPQQDWKGQLGGNAAIFIDKRGHDIMVAHKDDVEIEVRGKVLIGKTLKVSVTVAQHRLDGTISPESYERYQEWKVREEDKAVQAQTVDDDEYGSDEGIREKHRP
jgi:hypothetical protein